MQGHDASEMIAAMGICMGIAVAIVLTMLSALLIGGNAVQRRKWIPRYVIINGILAILFCSVIIFTQPKLDIASLLKLLLVIIVVALWAAVVTRVKWCKVCGQKLAEDGSSSGKICARCSL